MFYALISVSNFVLNIVAFASKDHFTLIVLALLEKFGKSNINSISGLAALVIAFLFGPLTRKVLEEFGYSIRALYLVAVIVPLLLASPVADKCCSIYTISSIINRLKMCGRSLMTTA